jgi:alpha-N-acetylglucosaminidase
MLKLVNDLDTLVYTNENYLLSSWIADAKQWAHGNASYAAYLEYQARNQLTLWGPQGEINDYASKQWAGIVGEYYVTRWQAFISTLVGTKANGEAYNATAVKQMMLDIGETWDLQIWGTQTGETWGTKGDTFEVVDSILKTWA